MSSEQQQTGMLVAGDASQLIRQTRRTAEKAVQTGAVKQRSSDSVPGAEQDSRVRMSSEHQQRVKLVEEAASQLIRGGGHLHVDSE